MNSRPRIIFFGTPYFVVPILKELISSFEVIGVVTMPDSIQGRKKLLTPTPVKVCAIENNIPIFDLHEIPQVNADLFVVAAYGKIISQEVLDIPKHGALNIHPSLLPKFRGPTPIQSAILAGEDISGISIIKMDDKMDHGPIISQWSYPFSSNDTFESLPISMFEDAAKKLISIIPDYLAGEITPVIQDEANATYCKMISKESGFFESTNPPSPEILDRMIRAYYPWPTAWTRLQIANGQWRMVKFLPDKMIQFEGGKPMKLKDAVNGYPELKQLLEELLLQQA